jgi:GntR family transcriptional regulator, transcriptional repressor for pyruvate dehydrogenase complex
MIQLHNQKLHSYITDINSNHKSVTNADALVAQIRDGILDGAIRPGDFLGSERDISENFKVSRNTAREALRSLSAMGAVEIKVGVKGGATIAEGDVNAIGETLAIQHCLSEIPEDEVLEIQSVLEGLAAERAAEHATAEDIENLETLLQEATQLINDAVAFSNSSLNFHTAIAKAAHSQALHMQLNSLRYVIWPPHNTIPQPKVAKNIIKSHRALLTLIKDQNAEGAREFMRDHIEHIRNQHQKIREKGYMEDAICC